MIIEVIHVCAYVWMTRDKIVKGKYSAGFNSAVADNNRRIEEIQANSENCGPPRGNKFDLEKRSKVKVTAWCQLKGLVTRTMHAKYQCSIFNTSEDMSQV